MKTNATKFSVLADKPQCGVQSNDLVRKPLQTLQAHVSSNGNNLPKKTGIKDNLKPARSNDNKFKKEMINEHTQTIEPAPRTLAEKGICLTLNEVTVDDLTTEGNPGEKYWEVLAEQRRLALENALTENKNLHKQVQLLEEKCRIKDAMLDEARTMAEVLQELLNDD